MKTRQYEMKSSMENFIQINEYKDIIDTYVDVKYRI